MRRALAALLATAAGSAAAQGPADAPASAEAWLSRMSHALATREYEGVFVYLHDGRIEAMRVVRTIGPQGPRDEVASLTGEPRAVVREHDALRSSGNGVTTVVASGPAVVFGAVPALTPGATRHYRLAIAGEDRVAGYAATVIDARPTDGDRYAYRLWIERESGMLLRSSLAAPDGAPIEQLMFTSLQLRPAAAGAATTPDAGQAQEGSGPRFSEPLPAGFRLVAAKPRQDARHHFVYSDGLASVSVYVEPVARGLEPITGGLRRGAINLYGHVADQRQIVVVGDVPVDTAHRIAVTLDPSSVR